MEFLYRMHLVEFNPSDENEIKDNWDWIKKAIALSSESLSLQIGNSNYSELPATIKTKIYKYLLRGRYRSTPFGLWAGVGIGSWGTINSRQEINLNYREIDPAINPQYQNSPNSNPENYRLAPGLKSFEFHIKYWNYSHKEQGWRICHLERNKIVDHLVKKFRGDKTFDFNEFQAFFKKKASAQVKKIWQMIIDAGLIIPELFPWNASLPSSCDISKDIKLDTRLTLDPAVKAKLETLPEEMGSLFVPINSGYLQNFKSWFLKNYDDRFVPLNLLSNDWDNMEVLNQKNDQFPKQDQFQHNGSFWPEEIELDLSCLFEKKPVKLPNHLQFVFKTGTDNQIFIENIVCNRPFSYSGRFSLDAGIAQIISKSIPSQTASEDFIYADLFIFDSDKSNYITRHKNLYTHTIYPFGSSFEKDVIGINDLLVGLRNDQVVLYCEKLKKSIIPVIQHPLNPTQISHSPTRLLWEVGSQNQVKFLPYYHPAFQESIYLPRLKWGKIIIQGRSWSVSIERFGNQKELRDYLFESKIPNEVLAGHLDRELLLDWTKPSDLDLLWEELQIQNQIRIYECVWKNDSAIYSQNGNALYPEFIHSWSRTPEKYPSPGFINRISVKNSKWVYARIFPKQDGYPPYFQTVFPNLVKLIKKEFSVSKWYFLNYKSPEPEIRIRFELAQKDQKNSMESKIRKLSENSGWIREVRFSDYFPETDKYGIRGMEISESVFFGESELILFGRNHVHPPLHTMDETQRLLLIAFLIEDVLLNSPEYPAIFDYFKSLVKQIPFHLKKELNRENLYQNAERDDNLKKDYSGLFFTHEFYSGKEKFSLLSNHIHMFCNRAFPEDTEEYESKLIYLLYRALGKEMFSEKKQG